MDLSIFVNFLTKAGVFALICLPIPMVLGMLWYGPLFGKPWMRAVGMTADEASMGIGLIIGTAVAWLVSSFASAVGVGVFFGSDLVNNMIEYWGTTNPAILLFIFITIAYAGYGLNHIILAKNYQSQSYTLAFIDFGYQYLSFLLIGFAQFGLHLSGWLS